MKKLFTILALLMAFTVNGFAKDFTFYVHASEQPNIYAWYGDPAVVVTSAWPGDKMNWERWQDTKNLWKYTLSTDNESINVIINSSSVQTSNIENITDDVCYIDFDVDNGNYEILSAATVTDVSIRGSFNNWSGTANVMTSSGANTWTGEIALPHNTGDITLKVLVDGNWIGYNTATITWDAPKGWIEDDNTDNHNVVLKNSTTGYETYTITGTWEENPFAAAHWTFKIEGKDKRKAFDELALTISDGRHILSTEFDGYPDDLQIKMTFKNKTDPYESRNGWGIGQISNIDNYNATEYSFALKGGDGAEFDLYATIGDLKKAAKNGTDEYVAGEWHSQGGVTFNVYSDCELESVVVLIPAISSVELPGGWNDWVDEGTFTKDADSYTWTGTLDLTNIYDNEGFKLLINESEWLGSNQVTIAEESSELVEVGSEGDNFTLLNETSGFQTYTVTATWTISSSVATGWTLKIEGKDARQFEYYIMKSDGTWSKGDKMTENNGVYTATISDWAGKYFAIAPHTALDASDNLTWSRVITPTSSDDFVVNFANYSDETTTGGKVWKIDASNTADVTINFTPAENKFEITNAEEFTIGQYGYSTYSRAQKYQVEGASVSFVTVSGSEATLVAVDAEKVLPAMEGAGKHAGVIIAGEAGAKAIIKSVYADAEAVDASANLLAGTGDNSYEVGTQFADGDTYTAYILAKPADKNLGFYLLDDSDRTIAAHKAFLAVPGESQAPFFGFGGNDTTGINGVDRGALSVEGCYTLDGRRVEQPTKGLYIMNGKKVLVK